MKLTKDQAATAITAIANFMGVARLIHDLETEEKAELTDILKDLLVVFHNNPNHAKNHNATLALLQVLRELHKVVKGEAPADGAPTTEGVRWCHECMANVKAPCSYKECPVGVMVVGANCQHQHEETTTGPTTNQINHWCPDCGKTWTTWPDGGRTPFPMNVYLRNEQELGAFIQRHTRGVKENDRG